MLQVAGENDDGETTKTKIVAEIQEMNDKSCAGLYGAGAAGGAGGNREKKSADFPK
jgi:hypothetical protein